MDITNSTYSNLKITKDEKFTFSKCNFATIFSEVEKIIIPDFKLQIINELATKYQVKMPNEEIIINYKILQLELNQENNSNENSVTIQFEFYLKTRGKLHFDFFNIKSFSFLFQPLTAFNLNQIKIRDFDYKIPVLGMLSVQIEKMSDLAQEEIFKQLIGDINYTRINNLFQSFSFLKITYNIFKCNINISSKIATNTNTFSQPINEKIAITINPATNCKWLAGEVTFIFNVKGDPNIYNFLSTVLTKKFLLFTIDNKGSNPLLKKDNYYEIWKIINNFYQKYKNECPKIIANTPDHWLLNDFLTSIIKEHLNDVKNKERFDNFAVTMVEKWLKCLVVNDNQHFGTFGYQYFAETDSKEYYFSFNQIKAGTSLGWSEYYLFNNVTFLFRP